MNSLVSIVVPVYNSEKYLIKCVDSILKQSYKNLEILLIDDGSTDRSYDICCDLAKKDNRIVVKQKSNGGVSSARNLGILTSNGEFILFVDSDDTVNEKYVELLVNPLLNNKYDVSICGFFDVVNDVYYKKIDINNISIEGNIEKIFFKIYPMIFSVCNIAYKRNFLNANRLSFDENMRQGEDIYFNINYFKYINSIFLVNEYLYNYYHREHDSLNKKAYIRDFAYYLMRLKSLKELLLSRNFINREQIIATYAIFGVYKFGIVDDSANSYFEFKERCRLIKSNLRKDVNLKKIKYKIFWFLLWHNMLILYCILLLRKRL